MKTITCTALHHLRWIIYAFLSLVYLQATEAALSGYEGWGECVTGVEPFCQTGHCPNYMFWNSNANNKCECIGNGQSNGGDISYCCSLALDKVDGGDFGINQAIKAINKQICKFDPTNPESLTSSIPTVVALSVCR